jgi:hypothetical protein
MRLNITYLSVKFESLSVCMFRKRCQISDTKRIDAPFDVLQAQFFKFVRWDSCFLIDFLLFQVSFRGVTLYLQRLVSLSNVVSVQGRYTVSLAR